MLTSPLFKLASRLACLAILSSAALWLSVSARATPRFDCVLSANIKKGGMTMLTCGTSAGDFYWYCDGVSCVSEPGMDNSAQELCERYATQGCPDMYYYE